MMRSPKRQENSEEGVSATIGTIMALMVFMFLFGMIQTQYVPVAMKDNEANHMHALEAQFNTVKEKIDDLILRNIVNYTSSSPITLGSEGVPVFAAPTPGFLTFDPTKETLNVTYMVTTNVSGTLSTTKMYGNTSGFISVYVPNRYYIQEGYIYSCGAVILYQPSGSVIKSDPGFTIVNKSGDISVNLRTIRLIGDSATKSGTSTISLRNSLIYTYKDSYVSSNMSQFVSSRLWINMTTSYPDAWEDWFNATLTGNGLNNGTDFTMTKTLINSKVYPYRYSLSIEVKNVKIFSIQRSLIEMNIGES